MNEYNKPNKKIVLELFACMLVIHQNGALLRNMATVKHCHHFQHLHLYTFKGGGQKKCRFCTLVKMMIIMDDPLLSRFLFVYPRDLYNATTSRTLP